MLALIFDKETRRLDRSMISLMDAGIQATGTSNVRVAETCLGRMIVDLLVIEKTTIGDALGDTIGMAEERNPYVVSILRTPDVAADQDELAPHFPSLHCVVGQDVPNEVAVKLGLASLRSTLIGAGGRPLITPRRRLATPAGKRRAPAPAAPAPMTAGSIAADAIAADTIAAASVAAASVAAAAAAAAAVPQSPAMAGMH